MAIHVFTFDDDEVKAMIGWADAAGIGFTYAPSVPNPDDASERALARLRGLPVTVPAKP